MNAPREARYRTQARNSSHGQGLRFFDVNADCAGRGERRRVGMGASGGRQGMK